ncbi:MAG: extracellular solute-binding protein [Candidatus Pacebacteria bacterium]|nr:extracellular solute-binding protein [Candidatus Paceibacterota bacterium]
MKGNFQIILVVIFVGLAVFAVMVFSGAVPIGKQKAKTNLGTVVMWGTVKSDLMAQILQDFNDVNKTFLVKYVQKFPDTFDKDLLEALAAGKGPDLFFLPDNLAYGYSNKIYNIPFSSYPETSFKNTFASAGEVFMTSKGILAFPISIDPLMMYYNRSILDSEDIVFPPKYWDEFINIVHSITQKSDDKQIIRSTVAMGQYSNVNNAKDILATLFMQNGNSIVVEKDGGFYSSLDLNQNSALSNMLSFYISFADPLKENYSWNRSLPNSQDAFSAEKLAFYFGYASELRSLINKNPNQNFQVTSFPQIKNAKFKSTSARVIGVAVSSFSKNLNTAIVAANLMATTDFAKKFSDATGVVPARRDLLAVKPTDAFFPSFYTSALFARSWLDPSPNDTDNIFRNMVDNVLSNKSNSESAISDASGKLNILLKK